MNHCIDTLPLPPEYTLLELTQVRPWEAVDSIKIWKGITASFSLDIDTIARGSGIFGSGHTYAGGPVAAAVTCRVIDYLKEHQLIERCAQMGQYLAEKLETLRSHPTVGDIRGKGLQRGIEFVKDKKTREPLNPMLHFSQQIQDEALRRGVHIESSFGCDRGQAGDLILFGPPFIITQAQIDEMIDIIDETLSVVEQRVDD